MGSNPTPRTTYGTRRILAGKIVETLLWLHRNGYAESNIPVIGRRLRHLAKHCNLEKPERVKRFIDAKRVK